MSKILTSSAAALAFLVLSANAPATAQTALESAYAQPAELVDGIHVGKRISRAASSETTTIVVAHRHTRSATAHERRHVGY